MARWMVNINLAAHAPRRFPSRRGCRPFCHPAERNDFCGPFSKSAARPGLPGTQVLKLWHDNRAQTPETAPTNRFDPIMAAPAASPHRPDGATLLKPQDRVSRAQVRQAVAGRAVASEAAQPGAKGRGFSTAADTTVSAQQIDITLKSSSSFRQRSADETPPALVTQFPSNTGYKRATAKQTKNNTTVAESRHVLTGVSGAFPGL